MGPELTLPAAADAYARMGLPVFPLRPRDKRPFLAGGFKVATTDAGKVQEWWSRWPDANIGCPTGEVSGFWVLDVDLPDGPESLRALETRHGELRPSARIRTGSGGLQFLFRHRRRIKCSAGQLGRGLDVRGDGGYIVLPPSIHPCGGMYRWERTV